MNDWKVERLLKLVICTQFILLLLLSMEFLGFSIPIIREMLSLFYILYIPGVLILRILKIHRLNEIETILFSVGLSIVFLMFVGFLINYLFRFLKIETTALSLFLTLSFFILILLWGAFKRNNEFQEIKNLKLDSLTLKWIILLSILPLISILGTYLMNIASVNIILMLLLIFLSIIPLYITFDKIPKILYPLSIFVIALSLLYHNSLISFYINGWDIHFEYYYASLALKTSFVDFNVAQNLNSMLSVTIVAPLFSKITSLSLVWVFKLIYPLLFALVPLGIYRIVEIQTNSKIAFLSSFFFMSVYVFFVELPTMIRQEMGELFFVLLILVILSKKPSFKTSFLLITFSLGLIFSHYALSYIFMGFLVIVLIYQIITSKDTKNPVNTILVAFFACMAVAWSIFTSSSELFYSFVMVGKTIGSNFYSDLFNVETVQGLRIATLKTSTSYLHQTYRYIQLIAQFFISLGILKYILRWEKLKFNRIYGLFSIMSFSMLLLALTVPFFASALNTTRLYHIALIVLSPFFVTGFIAFLDFFGKIINLRIKINIEKNYLKIVSGFLMVFLLFNTGFIYQVANDDSQTISLNSTFDSPTLNQRELICVEWFGNYKDSKRIFADRYKSLVLYGIFNEDRPRTFSDNKDKNPKGTYSFIGSANIETQQYVIMPRIQQVRLSESIDLSNIIAEQNEIYDNGGSQIYYY
ncbi:MAG: DUF2206 domain-containing protein [Methanobacterium sp.]|nr:DUF2206 domain-containing protein [Methanobacterium sp.]